MKKNEKDLFNQSQEELNRSLEWDSVKVEECERKIMEGEIIESSPFLNNDPKWRNSNITYRYTQEELDEIQKCMSDIQYYAEKYCRVMTDEGVANIELRDYQHEIIQSFKDNRFNILMSARQSGKTITTGIFISWYLCFNFDRNVLIIANKLDTTVEIIDKIKTILENLPFFLKPGVLVNNQKNMKFDNGCRLLGQATTKSAAIGFTLHLVYMDEMAHVHPNFLDPFYRSVYPTIASSKISKMIITSTPNGMNKFYEIYHGAISGTNEFKALRVDWFDVPGRDEEWKERKEGALV